jgi:peptide/nickel transport system permease protein
MPYVLRRLGFFVVTFWAAVSLNFIIPRLMPGNPVQALEAEHPHLNPQAIHSLTILLGGGYSGSLVSQYFTYWGRVLTLNFGISITTSFGTPVTTMVLHALPWTLGLVGVTTILAFLAGTLIGLVSAWRRGTLLDSALPPIFVITSAFPYFWVGLILIYVFAIRLGIFPQQGAYNFLNDSPGLTAHYLIDVFEHAVLPGLTILLTAIGGWILTMRNNVITVMADDYVRTARAKGLKPWRIMWAYVGRNAILPNLTGFAMSLGFVVSGAIVVEYVFNYPGLGTLLLTAVNGLDYPLMQALFLLITVAVLLSVLAADVATAIIDPRTRQAS